MGNGGARSVGGAAAAKQARRLNAEATGTKTGLTQELRQTQSDLRQLRSEKADPNRSSLVTESMVDSAIRQTGAGARVLREGIQKGWSPEQTHAVMRVEQRLTLGHVKNQPAYSAALRSELARYRAGDLSGPKPSPVPARETPPQAQKRVGLDYERHNVWLDAGPGRDRPHGETEREVVLNRVANLGGQQLRADVAARAYQHDRENAQGLRAMRGNAGFEALRAGQTVAFRTPTGGYVVVRPHGPADSQGRVTLDLYTPERHAPDEQAATVPLGRAGFVLKGSTPVATYPSGWKPPSENGKAGRNQLASEARQLNNDLAYNSWRLSEAERTATANRLADIRQQLLSAGSTPLASTSTRSRKRASV